MNYGPENPIFDQTSSEERGDESVGRRRSRRANPLEYDPNGNLYQGSLIRQMRQERGISIDKLAELAGYHPSALSKVETNRGSPGKEKLKKIADVFGIPEDVLKQAPLHPHITQRRPESRRMLSNSSVKQIMDEFGLSQAEKELTRQLILNFTRSMSMGLKEMRIKENAPKPQDNQGSQ